MAVMLCCFSRPMNLSSVWLEWPMVNSVGWAAGFETDCTALVKAEFIGAEFAGVEFVGADTWAV